MRYINSLKLGMVFILGMVAGIILFIAVFGSAINARISTKKFISAYCGEAALCKDLFNPYWISQPSPKSLLVHRMQDLACLSPPQDYDNGQVHCFHEGRRIFSYISEVPHHLNVLYDDGIGGLTLTDKNEDGF